MANDDFKSAVQGMNDVDFISSVKEAKQHVKMLTKKWESQQISAEDLVQEGQTLRGALDVLREERTHRAAEDAEEEDDGTAEVDRPLHLATGWLDDLLREARSRKSTGGSAATEPPRRRRRVDGAGAGSHPAPQTPLPEYQQYINGRWRTSVCKDWINVEDPSTLATVCRITAGDSKDATDALAAAKAAQLKWARVPAPTRAGYLKKIAGLIRENRVRLARILACEQSKVLGLAQIEIDFTAEYYDYYAGWARIYEGEVVNSDRDDEHIYVHRQPVGVSVGIVPWNFPVFVMARKVAPALLAGCSVVIKTASQTPHACNEIAKLIDEAQVPPGVFNVVNGSGRKVGQVLIDSPIPAIISLTGSVGTGQQVMKAAAQNLTKVSLELGGKAPAIVCADADIDLAVKAVVASRMCFTGQVCNCAERLYVEASIADEFTTRLVKAFKALRVGDPFDEPAPDCAALVSKDQIDKVESMVNRAVAAGAKVLCGGARDRSCGKGHYFQPTLLANCAPDSEIVKDEVFGPVLPICTFTSLDEAIEMANDSEYGLTSSIFTRDINKAHRAMEELQFGETYVNREHFEAIQGFHAGWRKSGIGGADGKHGLFEYLHTHIMYVRYDKEAGKNGSVPFGSAAGSSCPPTTPRTSSSAQAARNRLLQRLSGGR